jgi:uncharacterized FAD-dependent dehydrogenase
MIRLTEIRLPLNHNDETVEKAVLKKLFIKADDLICFTVFKRSVDARKKAEISFIYTVDVDTRCNDQLLKRFVRDTRVFKKPDTTYKLIAKTDTYQGARPVVVGFGPGGIFAGILLAQMGLKPVILERGKKVRERAADTFGFWRKRIFNPDSNVQFGEGGAGTFSDGKLYSQIKDKNNRARKVLTELVNAGANKEILYVHRPHIGTFKLVKIIENMRATIESLGGDIRFESQVEELLLTDGRVKGIKLSDKEIIETDHVVLAIGHSARDSFQMLYDKGVYIEAKPFSIGFRIEHPQGMIDRCRWGANAGNKLLGSADYKVVHHCRNGRSVYSFCMCPGGIVVAATSEEGLVVTNGMSQYSRNEQNANSGIVVGITPEQDYSGHPLAGIDFQRKIEEKAFILGGRNYDAPGQLLGDYLKGIPSTEIGDVIPSYRPGVNLGDLSKVLPGYAIEAIREAIPAFANKIHGFDRYDAVLTGVETRTSSPLRIKRNSDSFQSVNTICLYRCGECA